MCMSCETKIRYKAYVAVVRDATAIVTLLYSCTDPEFGLEFAKLRMTFVM